MDRRLQFRGYLDNFVLPSKATRLLRRWWERHLANDDEAAELIRSYQYTVRVRWHDNVASE